MRRLQIMAMAASLALAAPASGSVPKALEPLSFLLGVWEAGANAGAHGQGTGSYSFAPSLQDRAIIRTNHAEYPATEKTPALTHDDLMVIYATEGGAEAHFYDNEGHMIHYAVSAPAPGEATFVSDVVASAPRYRLSYKLRADGVLEGRFEIAPPGKPDAFAKYLAWESHRPAAGGK
jgi:hypothetical protein